MRVFVLLSFVACTQAPPTEIARSEVAPSACPPAPQCPPAPRCERPQSNEPRTVTKPFIDYWFEKWNAARACVVRHQSREKCMDELELLMIDAQIVSSELFGHCYRLAETTTQAERTRAIEQLDLDARVLEPFRSRP